MIDWLSFETAPKDGRDILVWATTCDVTGKEYHGPHVTSWFQYPRKSGWHRSNSWYHPSHWAEINEPNDRGYVWPEEEDENVPA